MLPRLVAPLNKTISIGLVKIAPAAPLVDNLYRLT